MSTLEQLSKAWASERAHGGRRYPEGRAGKVPARMQVRAWRRTLGGARLAGKMHARVSLTGRFMSQSYHAGEKAYQLYQQARAEGWVATAHDELVADYSELETRVSVMLEGTRP